MKSIAEQFFLILSYAGIVQGPFVVLLLNKKEGKKSRANLFLSILMIAFSFSISHIFFAESIVSHLPLQVFSLGDPTFFLIAPLVWFYTLELMGYRIQWSWKILLHFIPFFIMILLSTTFKMFVSVKACISFLEQNYRLIQIVFWIIVVLQFSLYHIISHKKWTLFQELIRQEVSYTEHVDLSWVRFFMIVFLMINIFFLFSLFAAIHLENSLWLTKIAALIFSLSVFALGYKGILQKDIFYKKEDDKISNRKQDSIDRPAIDQPNQELVDRILKHMEEEKPYLDSELSLSTLATDLKIGRSQLSQLINVGIGQNFYDFVNKYRVEQVKKMMVDPKMKNYNMLGIALEAGFKSKSTFNLIFKRFTGLTPTEYRKNLSD